MPACEAALDIHWDDDGTTNDGEHNKHVSAHVREPEEYHSIQSDLVNQLLFSCLRDRDDPICDSFSNWWRSMLLIGMTKFRGIRDGIIGPKKGEGQRDQDGKPNGNAESRQEGGRLNLE